MSRRREGRFFLYRVLLCLGKFAFCPVSTSTCHRMDQKEAGGSAAAPAPLAEAGAGGDEAGAAQPIRSLSAWLKEVRGSEAA